VTRSRSLLVWFALSAATAAAVTAQGDRHEIGLRLRSFERSLAEVEDLGRRDAAFVELERAVQAFFGLDMKRVAASIDAATLALAGRAPPPVERYARSLQLRLGRRLVDSHGGALSIEVRRLFEVEDTPEPAPELTVAWRLHSGGSWVRRALGELPEVFELDLEELPAGDHVLRWSIADGERVLVEREMAFAAAIDLDGRLAAVEAAAGAAKKISPRSIESLTLASLWSLLRTTQRRAAYETELHGAALLDEAERLARWVKSDRSARVYDRERPGSFRVRVPVGERAVSCRLFAPELAVGERPIVVALHGAGGSENLFFDGYGDGLCVELARQRGWFVVAPRNGMGFVDCVGLVDALSERFPIDRGQVFVVGHSMGAMQAVSNASRTPARFRAVAPIAGGGRVSRSEELKSVPFFVSAGARDFGRDGANGLHRQLLAAGVDSSWRLYPSVEHLAVVQVALPDVFAFFDEHAR